MVGSAHKEAAIRVSGLVWLVCKVLLVPAGIAAQDTRIDALGEKRTASVRAITFCEAFTLAREDFNPTKEQYPEIGEVLKRISSENSTRNSDLLIAGVIV